MPNTRHSDEIEQLKALVHELKRQVLSQPDNSQQSEIDALRDELAGLRAQIVPPTQAQGGDAFRLPDPFKYLSEFTGNKKELSAWLEEVDDLYNDYKVKTSNGGYSLSSLYIRAIKNKVKGEARTLLCANGNPNTIDGIKRILVEHYGDEKDFITNLSTLFHTRKGDKSHTRFYNDMREVNIKLKANLQTKPLSGHEIIEIITVARYLDNIQEPLGSIIRNSKPKNLEEAHQAVLLNQNAESRVKHKPQTHTHQSHPFRSKYTGSDKNNNNSDFRPRPGATPNTNYKQNNHDTPFKKQPYVQRVRAEAHNIEVEEAEEPEVINPEEEVDDLEISDEEINFQTAKGRLNQT